MDVLSFFKYPIKLLFPKKMDIASVWLLNDSPRLPYPNNTTQALVTLGHEVPSICDDALLVFV